MGSGNYAYAHFDIGGEAEILGFGISGGASVNFQASLEAKVTQNIGFDMASITSAISNLTMMGCASVGASFNLEVCAGPLGCAGGTVSKDVSANFGIENGSPKLAFSYSSCGNGMPAMILNDSGY